jgi:hypothetical protein
MRTLETMDHLSCMRCGETFPAPEGSALLYSLKSSCPSCGGEFRLVLAGDIARLPVDALEHAGSRAA